MANFFLDTGILLGYARGSDYARSIENEYNLFSADAFCFVSIVSVGELYSLALQFKWGEEKKERLKQLIKEIPVIDINSDEILLKYAEIDCYSLRKNGKKKIIKEFPARKMGKNDLWIAATASVLKSSLLTIDSDFDHLDDVFLDVIRIDKDDSLSKK